MIYGVREWVIQVLGGDGTVADGKGLTTNANIGNISQTFDNTQRSGYRGVINFAQSLELGEVSLTFMSISEEFQTTILRTVKKTCSLQLNAAAENQEAGTVIPYELILRGLVGEFPTGGDFTPGEDAEFTMTFQPNRKSRQIGTSTFLYDPISGEWVVNGVNEFDAINQALGM